MTIVREYLIKAIKDLNSAESVLNEMDMLLSNAAKHHAIATGRKDKAHERLREVMKDETELNVKIGNTLYKVTADQRLEDWAHIEVVPIDYVE